MNVKTESTRTQQMMGCDRVSCPVPRQRGRVPQNGPGMDREGGENLEILGRLKTNRKQQPLSGLPCLLWSSCRFPGYSAGCCCSVFTCNEWPMQFSDPVQYYLLLFCCKTEETEAPEGWLAQGYGSGLCRSTQPGLALHLQMLFTKVALLQR